MKGEDDQRSSQEQTNERAKVEREKRHRGFAIVFSGYSWNFIV